MYFLRIKITQSNCNEVCVAFELVNLTFIKLQSCVQLLSFEIHKCSYCDHVP